MQRYIPVAVSARHVHLNQQTVDALFGPGHRLQVRTPLSQTGQFAALETVTLSGPRGRIEAVRVAEDYRLELHLDTDEANACGLKHGDHALFLGPGAG